MSAAPAEAPWYADGLRFRCTQCGNCCGGAPGYVWVDEDESAAIAAALGQSLPEFHAQHTRRAGGRRSLLERPGGDCEFLARDPGGKARCTIYDVRPQQCRTWPFWKSNLASPAAWAAAGRTCPGLNTGEHHPLPVIQAALRRNGQRPL